MGGEGHMNCAISYNCMWVYNDLKREFQKTGSFKVNISKLAIEFTSSPEIYLMGEVNYHIMEKKLLGEKEKKL